MWVEGGDIQDELLDQLGAVLTAPKDLALIPSAAELEALASAVATRWPDGEAAVPAASPVRLLRNSGPRPLRRLGSSAWRAGSAAAAMVVLSASAAAAASGVPLPRPVRAVAYTVGLPVDSPALDDTNHHIKELKDAVKANDKPKAVATAKRLTTDLAKVPAEEKKEAEQKVGAVMVQAAPLIQSPAPTTAATSPVSSSTTATSPASSTTATTAAGEEKVQVTTTTSTTAPATTTTASEATTTTTAPATGQTPPDGSGTTPGDSGTGSADQGAGGAGTGTGGGGPGSTTNTTTPDSTTTTTVPPESTTTTTPPDSTTTTTSTTTPPPNPAPAGTQ